MTDQEMLAACQFKKGDRIVLGDRSWAHPIGTKPYGGMSHSIEGKKGDEDVSYIDHGLWATVLSDPYCEDIDFSEFEIEGRTIERKVWIDVRTDDGIETSVLGFLPESPCYEIHYRSMESHDEHEAWVKEWDDAYSEPPVPMYDEDYVDDDWE